MFTTIKNWFIRIFKLPYKTAKLAGNTISDIASCISHHIKSTDDNFLTAGLKSTIVGVAMGALIVHAFFPLLVLFALLAWVEEDAEAKQKANAAAEKTSREAGSEEIPAGHVETSAVLDAI